MIYADASPAKPAQGQQEGLIAAKRVASAEHARHFVSARRRLVRDVHAASDRRHTSTMPHSHPELFLGLISGTSADGIDAALVRLRRRRAAALRARAAPIPGTPRCATRLVALGQGGDATFARRTRQRSTCRSRRRSPMPRCSLLDEAGVDAGAGPRARLARPDRAPSAAQRDGRRRSPGSSATATSSPNAPASPRSPISAAAMSPPAARARRWCRRSMPRCCVRRTRTARCSTSAASPTSPCCRRDGDGARLRHRPGQCAAGCVVRAPHRRRRSMPMARSRAQRPRR